VVVKGHVQWNHARTLNDGVNTRYDEWLTKVEKQIQEIHGVLQQPVEGRLKLHNCPNEDGMSKLERQVDEIYALLHKFISSVGGDSRSGKSVVNIEEQVTDYNTHDVDVRDKVLEKFEFMVPEQGGTICRDKEVEETPPLDLSSSVLVASGKETSQPIKTIEEKPKGKKGGGRKRKSTVPISIEEHVSSLIKQFHRLVVSLVGLLSNRPPSAP